MSTQSNNMGCGKLIAYGFLGLLMFFIFSAIINSLIEPRKTPQQRNAEIEAELLKKQNEPDAVRDISVKQNAFNEGGFGTVALHDVTLTNTSDKFGYKDITLKFSYKGESGTVIQEKLEVVYKSIKPKSKARIREINTGFIDKQAASCQVEVISAEPL